MNKQQKTLCVFEEFAGYGGGSFALKRLKELHPEFNYEIVGYFENDKYACEFYDLNHRKSKGEKINTDCSFMMHIKKRT